MNCVIHHYPMVITLSERDKIEKHCNSLNFQDFPSESEVVNIFNKFYSNASQYKFSQSYLCRDNTEKWFVFTNKKYRYMEISILFCKYDIEYYI